MPAKNFVGANLILLISYVKNLKAKSLEATMDELVEKDEEYKYNKRSKTKRKRKRWGYSITGLRIY